VLSEQNLADLVIGWFVNNVSEFGSNLFLCMVESMHPVSYGVIVIVSHYCKW